jgi:acetyl-CoA carboxylase, biotin carboxylase subunit
LDTHIYDGYAVPPNYDAMIGKVIAHGPNRTAAIARMRVALGELVVEGIKTNIPLQQKNMLDQVFQLGGFNIHYLERRLLEQKG